MSNISLLEVNKNILSCTRCDLHRSVTNIVAGEGNDKAKLFIVGEAPGKQEDETGSPFVGRSGRLLENTLALFNMKRSDVFISNIVHCRPPNNRTPEKSEINSCISHIKSQILAIKPIIILTLGSIATFSLLKHEDKSISHIRGQYFNYIDEDFCCNLIPTFHPSYILRNQFEKESFVRDVSVAIEDACKI